MNMELEELCAFSDEEYVRKAVLAKNRSVWPSFIRLCAAGCGSRRSWMKGCIWRNSRRPYLKVWQTYIGQPVIAGELTAQECAYRGVSYLQEAGENSGQRAVYRLRRALAGDEENRVEIAGALAEACHDQLDYQGEYEAAWQAVAALAANPHSVGREFRRTLYVRAAPMQP